MKIKALENVSYNGKKYRLNEEYTVDNTTAYALGNSVEIVSVDKPKVKQPKTPVKRTVMTRRQVRTK